MVFQRLMPLFSKNTIRYDRVESEEDKELAHETTTRVKTRHERLKETLSRVSLLWVNATLLGITGLFFFGSLTRMGCRNTKHPLRDLISMPCKQQLNE